MEVPTAWAGLVTSLSFRGAPGTCRVEFLPQLGAAAPSRLWGCLTLPLACPML